MSAIDILKSKRENYSSDDSDMVREFNLTDEECEKIGHDSDVTLKVNGVLQGNKLVINSVEPHEEKDVNASGEEVPKQEIVRTHTQLMPS